MIKILHINPGQKSSKLHEILEPYMFSSDIAINLFQLNLRKEKEKKKGEKKKETE